jgi:hypothetical protein
MEKDLNEGFSKRELKMLEKHGYSATALEKISGGWRVFLFDVDARGRGEVVIFGTGETRLDALQDALTRAQELPRCSCGGPISDRYRVCVRCDKPIASSLAHIQKGAEVG